MVAKKIESGIIMASREGKTKRDNLKKTLNSTPSSVMYFKNLIDLVNQITPTSVNVEINKGFAKFMNM